MAQYNYDGGLASYFLLTFLVLVLIPTTLSIVTNLRKRATVPPTCQLHGSRPFQANQKQSKDVNAMNALPIGII
jgi:preprotein translocase subunit Sec63